MSYSLRSKGRAPLGELGEKKKKTPRKSPSRRLKSTDDGVVDPESETDNDSTAGAARNTSWSEAEDSSSNLGTSPFVESSSLASLIEKSWKSGIAELVGRKGGEAIEGEKGEEEENTDAAASVGSKKPDVVDEGKVEEDEGKTPYVTSDAVAEKRDVSSQSPESLPCESHPRGTVGMPEDDQNSADIILINKVVLEKVPLEVSDDYPDNDAKEPEVSDEETKDINGEGEERKKINEEEDGKKGGFGGKELDSTEEAVPLKSGHESKVEDETKNAAIGEAETLEVDAGCRVRIETMAEESMGEVEEMEGEEMEGETSQRMTEEQEEEEKEKKLEEKSFEEEKEEEVGKEEVEKEEAEVEQVENEEEEVEEEVEAEKEEEEVEVVENEEEEVEEAEEVEEVEEEVEEAEEEVEEAEKEVRVVEKEEEEAEKEEEEVEKGEEAEKEEDAEKEEVAEEEVEEAEREVEKSVDAAATSSVVEKWNSHSEIRETSMEGTGHDLKKKDVCEKEKERDDMDVDVDEDDEDDNGGEDGDNAADGKRVEEDVEDGDEDEIEEVVERRQPQKAIVSENNTTMDDNFNETSKPVSKVPEEIVVEVDADEDEDEEENDEENADQEALKLAALFKDPEEAALESLVFGDTDEIVQELEDSEKKKKKKKKKIEKESKKEETKASRKRKRIVGEEEQEKDERNEGIIDGERRKTAVWSDEDDDEESIDTSDPRRGKLNLGAKREEGVIHGAALKKKLRREFEKVVGETPAWAVTAVDGKKKKKKTLADDDDSGEDDEEDNPLLTRAGDFLNKSKAEKLGFSGGMLDFKKCCRANRQEKGKQIKTIQFHPTAQVLMTTGLDETLRIYQVDGVENPKIQSVDFERFPIHRSAFTHDGSSVVLTSKKPWFKIYDMMTGNATHVPAIKNKQELNKFRLTPDGRSITFLGSHGFVYVVDLASKEIVSTVKMNARVRDVAFLSRGSVGDDVMLTHGDDGFVYVWDFRRSESCLHKFVDDGCISGSVVRTSSDSRFIACGSASGILNLYSAEEALLRPTPKPRKTLQNLVTTVRDVEFNRTCELMAFATGEMMNGVRLAHVPTMNVYSNFPTAGAMSKPRSIAFSPYSGYFAVADSKDIVGLFRLNHYENF